MYNGIYKMMKYMAVGFIYMFFVLGAEIVKPGVEVDLPSDASLWMVNLSADILAVPHSVGASDSGQNFLPGDLSEDLDDAFINMRGVDFFAWSGISQDGPGVFPPILWGPLPKIPII